MNIIILKFLKVTPMASSTHSTFNSFRASVCRKTRAVIYGQIIISVHRMNALRLLATRKCGLFVPRRRHTFVVNINFMRVRTQTHNNFNIEKRKQILIVLTTK